MLGQVEFVESALAEVGQQRRELFDRGVRRSREKSGGPGLLRQTFDAGKKLGVLVADFPNLGEILQFALFLFILARDGFLGIQLGKQIV